MEPVNVPANAPVKKTKSRTQDIDPNEFISCKKELFGEKSKRSVDQQRCPVPKCNKKIKLTDKDFKCKCDKFHCRLHRAGSLHNCKFDYNAEQISRLQDTKDTKVNQNNWCFGAQGNTTMD